MGTDNPTADVVPFDTRAPKHVSVSVIVPTYREADNLPLLVPRISLALAGYPHEIIIVDDDSRDGTDRTVAVLKQKGHAVRLITRTDVRGLSSAVLRGFDEAKGDVLICMDADLSHPPEALPYMIEALRQDKIEFVIGSRYVEGGATDADWSLLRRLNSKVATVLARPFCSARDPLAGFFGLPKKVFARAESLCPIGYKIGLELIVKCRCHNISEVPIQFSDRHFGESKLNSREIFNYIRHLKRLSDFKFGAWSQLGQFYIVGASGMVIDLLVYWFLLRAAVALPVARAFAIFAAISWNFILNRRFSFSGQRFGKSTIRQYTLWLASCAFGAVISWSVSMGLCLFTGFFASHIFLAAVLGIMAGSITNFFLARYWVFSGPLTTK